MVLMNIENTKGNYLEGFPFLRLVTKLNLFLENQQSLVVVVTMLITQNRHLIGIKPNIRPLYALSSASL